MPAIGCLAIKPDTLLQASNRLPDTTTSHFEEDCHTCQEDYEVSLSEKAVLKNILQLVKKSVNAEDISSTFSSGE